MKDKSSRGSSGDRHNAQPGGLLHDLAQRALGLEMPLRSQRAQRREAARPGERQAPLSELAVQQPTLQTAQAQPHEPGPAIPTAPVALVTPRVAATSTPPLPLPAQQAAYPQRHPEAPVPRRRETGAAPPPLLPQPAAAAATTAALASPAQPASATATHMPATPALLLPRVTPQPSAASAPSMAATSGSRREARERSAAAAPTEVHVSIGRVELTALAQAAAPRTPPRRNAAAGHSLADYLRGSKRPP